MSQDENSLLSTVSRLSGEGAPPDRVENAFYDLIRKKARAKGIPVSGIFELTPLCNLDCKMCYVHLAKAKPLDTGTWISLIDQAIEEGLLWATLTGGECLTHPGFKEIYSHLADRGIKSVVCTNGVLVDEDMIAFFLRRKPYEIQISLYGSSDDAYEKVTGHRVFHTVFSHMLALRDAGLRVSAAVTPSADMEDAESIMRLLHENGFFIRLNRTLSPPRSETGRTADPIGMDRMIRLEKLKREIAGLPMYPPVREEDLPPTGGPCTGTQPLISCGAARSQFLLNWHGQMNPCADFPGIVTEPLKTGFHAAWKEMSSGIVSHPGLVECAGCAYARFCDKCVARHILMGAPAGHAHPDVCEFARQAAKAGLVDLGKNP
jgi:radical SAM protein with 4Fe4S-binding SPASM domain